MEKSQSEKEKLDAELMNMVKKKEKVIVPPSIKKPKKITWPRMLNPKQNYLLGRLLGKKIHKCKNCGQITTPKDAILFLSEEVREIAKEMKKVD